MTCDIILSLTDMYFYIYVYNKYINLSVQICECRCLTSGTVECLYWHMKSYSCLQHWSFLSVMCNINILAYKVAATNADRHSLRWPKWTLANSLAVDDSTINIILVYYYCIVVHEGNKKLYNLYFVANVD